MKALVILRGTRDESSSQTMFLQSLLNLQLDFKTRFEENGGEMIRFEDKTAFH